MDTKIRVRLAICCGFLALVSGALLAQPTSDPSFGKSRVQVPQPTDEGS